MRYAGPRRGKDGPGGGENGVRSEFAVGTQDWKSEREDGTLFSRPGAARSGPRRRRARRGMFGMLPSIPRAARSSHGLSTGSARLLSSTRRHASPERRPRVPSGDPPGPDALLPVGVHCSDLSAARGLEQELTRLGGVRCIDIDVATPHVWVCAAHSPHESAALLGRLPSPNPAVLLDLGDSIGPDAAALQGYLGYLWPAVPWGRQLCCLRHCAAGLQDAPDPRSVTFHAAWRRGPLSDLEKRILRLYARGRTREKIAEELEIAEPTLDHRVTALRRHLGVPPRELLALRAERLGYGPP